MKFIKTIILATASVLLVSCASVTVDKKDIKYMPIRFKPLTKNDFTLVGNLESKSTMTGKGTTPDKEFRTNLKEGKVVKNDAHEVIYFTPGPNEVVTGSLYENELFNFVGGPTGVKGRITLLQSLKRLILGSAANFQPKDFPLILAYYDLVKKYPDVDYFINVRFDRKKTMSGAKWTEVIVAKADGIKLKTDN